MPCPRPNTRWCISASSARKASLASGCPFTPRFPFSLAGGTHEVLVQATTAASQPLYENGHQPTLLGRVQNFWQLSRSTYAQLGFTATGGNNGDLDLHSRLLGLDFRLTYRPPEAGTRRDMTFRAEGYRLHASEAGVTTNRYGAFLDLQARTAQRWIFGARYDYSQSPRGAQDTQWALIPEPHLVGERIRLPAAQGRAPPQRAHRQSEPADVPGGLGHGPAQTRDVLNGREAAGRTEEDEITADC